MITWSIEIWTLCKTNILIKVMRDKKIERKLFQFKGVPGKMNITELRYS
jgi:hypothetical protein